MAAQNTAVAVDQIRWLQHPGEGDGRQTLHVLPRPIQVVPGTRVVTQICTPYRSEAKTNSAQIIATKPLQTTAVKLCLGRVMRAVLRSWRKRSRWQRWWRPRKIAGGRWCSARRRRLRACSSGARLHGPWPGSRGVELFGCARQEVICAPGTIAKYLLNIRGRRTLVLPIYPVRNGNIPALRWVGQADMTLGRQQSYQMANALRPMNLL